MTAETINDPSTNNVAVPCEQPAASMDLTKDQASSDTLSGNAQGTTSSLSNLLVYPALNSLESAVPKQPTTEAWLLTSYESLRLLEEKRGALEK